MLITGRRRHRASAAHHSSLFLPPGTRRVFFALLHAHRKKWGQRPHNSGVSDSRISSAPPSAHSIRGTKLYRMPKAMAVGMQQSMKVLPAFR